MVNFSIIFDAQSCLCESELSAEHPINKLKVSVWYYSSMLINVHIMAYRYLSIINTIRCVNTEQQGVGELCDTSLKT